HDLVDLAGDDVLLERQLDAVREALQQPEGARPVGTDAQLHPADDAALDPHRHQHGHDQEREDGDDLAADQPPRVRAEVLQRGVRGDRRQGRHGERAHLLPPAFSSEAAAVAAVAPASTPPAIRTTSPATAPRSRYSEQPAELVGSHTTRSGRSAVTSRGSVTSPRSVDTVTASPAPISAAVAGDSRATAALAVPARNGSPSCRRPRSSSSRHVASSASPRSGTGASACGTSGASGRSPR